LARPTVIDPAAETSPASAIIRQLLARYDTSSPPHGAAGAAVSILLRSGATDVEVLLIERALRDGDPASGQIGLPGGRVEAGDGPLVRTALRECQEEVGIHPDDLVVAPRFVGFEIASAVGLKVGVFAAELAPAHKGPVSWDSEEVAHVFWASRPALREGRRVVRETVTGPRAVDATVIGGHVLWGFTRRVLRDFFEIPNEASAH
jgi:8-oxo-dGTP pyrophosphatase MutT (NUDIX family)